MTSKSLRIPDKNFFNKITFNNGRFYFSQTCKDDVTDSDLITLNKYQAITTARTILNFYGSADHE